MFDKMALWATVGMQRLAETTDRYEVEVNGALIWDHSRWDHSRWADECDDARIDRMLELMFGDPDRSNRRKLHDAMAVATTARYGHSHFVTSDGHVLKAAQALLDEFNVQVITPERAVEFIERMIHRWRFLRDHQRNR